MSVKNPTGSLLKATISSFAMPQTDSFFIVRGKSPLSHQFLTVSTEHFISFAQCSIENSSGSSDKKFSILLLGILHPDEFFSALGNSPMLISFHIVPILFLVSYTDFNHFG